MEEQITSQPKEVPSWLAPSLSNEDLALIEKAVKTAEARTSAEIVPMVVRRSTLHATGERILFWISLVVIAFFFVGGFSAAGRGDVWLVDRLVAAGDVWPTPEVHMWLVIFADLVTTGIVLGLAWLFSRFLSRFDRIHHVVFPACDLTFEAEHRAQLEFYSSDLRSTTGSTGVLLFVSMLERRAVILPDQAIAKKFKPEVWHNMLNDLLRMIGEGKMGQGLAQTIEAIGRLVASEFPIQPDDVNELGDSLRILD